MIAALGKTLIVVGLLLLGLAVTWWYVFFEQMLGEDVKQASECFYFTTDVCAVGNVVGLVSEIPAYSPVAFWISAAALVIGIAALALAPRGG